MKLSSRVLSALFPVVLATASASCVVTSEDVGSNESAVTVCGKTTIKGIDVYHGDNGGSAINWNAVKSAGIDFAFAKATESTNFNDPAFATNWAGMKSAGIVRGAYHFFHSDVDPVAQANFFLAAVGAVSAGDLLVLDLESTNGQTEATVSSRAATFLSTVKSATGVTPFLYTSPAFLSSFSAFGSYPLWVANYGVSCPNVPSPWATYTFWQSTGSGSLSAISGALDLDSFNGTLAELQALGGKSTSDGGTAADASTTDDASASDAGSMPGADGSVPGPGPGSDAGAGDSNYWQTGGCTMTPVEPRGTRTGALATLLGLFVMGMRRRRA